MKPVGKEGEGRAGERGLDGNECAFSEWGGTLVHRPRTAKRLNAARAASDKDRERCACNV